MTGTGEMLQALRCLVCGEVYTCPRFHHTYYCGEGCFQAAHARAREEGERQGRRYARELAAMGLVDARAIAGPAAEPLQVLRVAGRAECAHCGEVIEGGRADRRYCGARCRVAAMRRRREVVEVGA